MTDKQADTPKSRKDMLRLRNGFTVRSDGSEEPTYGYYVTEDDYRTLGRDLTAARQQLDSHIDILKQVQAERDAIRLATIEEAAKVCDEQGHVAYRMAEQGALTDDVHESLASVSVAIRQLKEKA